MFNFLKKKLAKLRKSAVDTLSDDEPSGKGDKGKKRKDAADKGGGAGAEANAGGKVKGKKGKLSPGPVRKRKRAGGAKAPGEPARGKAGKAAAVGAPEVTPEDKTQEEVKPGHITTGTAFPTRRRLTRVARKKADDMDELGRARGEQKDLLPDDAEGGIFSHEISEKKMEKILWDLEMALLESDVALPVVDLIKAELKKELVGRKIKRKYDIGELIEGALKNAISNALSAERLDFNTYVKNHRKPVVIMFVGVNGSGKTTTIAKIVYRLKELQLTPVIAACDTFRAGAIQQLEKHADKLGVRLIKHNMGSDPAAVAYDAIEHARARSKDVVLIDTAGRMQTNVNLMDEMKKIRRIADPDMVIFVGDALTGNDTVEQARKFNEAVNIDAAVLTKIDADAKGGAALSIAHAVGKPILFVGIGQEYNKLVAFNPRWMLDRLFGSGAAS